MSASPVEPEQVGPADDSGRPDRLHRARWVGVGLLALVCLGGALWTWWLPHYRPALHDGERYGIDVSNHQGDIDWTRVAGDDIDFAYIKATEGGDWVDARFSTNWSAAGDAGLDRGAYHFFTLCRPGEEQADNFLEVVRDVGELPPALDLELAGNCSSRPDPDVVLAEVTAFIERVESATGRRVLLYVGDDWESVYPVRDRLDRLLWHRRWYRRPNVDGWLIWQVTGMAHVDGITGDVDFDVMRPSM